MATSYVQSLAPIPRLEVISPAMAKELLSRNTGNRSVSQNLVKSYARDIKEGRWRVNGETIKISTDGMVIDGQHRLLACVMSGVSIQTFVIYDLKNEVFDTIDIGRKRTVGDALTHDGVDNANATGAALRWVLAIQQDVLNCGRVTPAIARQMLVDEPGFEESARVARRSYSVLRGGIGGALHFLFAEKDRANADKFFADLASGIGLSADDPVYLLRERLTKEAMSIKSKMPPREIINLVIRAWNVRRSGKKLRMLKGSIATENGRVYPEIL